MAQLRGWSDGSTAASSAPARLRYKPLVGEHHFLASGSGGSDGIVLAVGTQLIFDFARFYEGEISFTPKFDDTRMVLRGEPLPPYSGDERYSGGIQIDAIVQRHGVCSLTSTSASLIRAIDLLHDNYICAPEAAAGKLPVYRLEEPRSYTIQMRADLLYAPVYTLISWVDRDSLKLGVRLIRPPKQLDMRMDALAAPTVPDVFEAAPRSGVVIPPQPALGLSRPAPRSGPSKLVAAGDDLDDAIPF